MNILKPIFGLLMLFPFMEAKSQDFCVVEPVSGPPAAIQGIGNSPNTNFTACGTYEDYVADVNNLDEYSTLYVRVNFHYLSSSTEQSFTNSTSGSVTHTAEQFSELVINGINNFYNNLDEEVAILYGTTIEDPNMKIQFVTGGTYVHTSETLTSPVQYTSAYNAGFNDYNNQLGENLNKTINVYFTKPTKRSLQNGQMLTAIGGRNSGSSVILEGVMSSYEDAGNSFHYYLNYNLSHEIGHALGIIDHRFYPSFAGKNCNMHLTFPEGSMWATNDIFDTPSRQLIIDSRSNAGLPSSTWDPCDNPYPWGSCNFMYTTDGNCPNFSATPGQVALARYTLLRSKRSLLDDGELPIEYYGTALNDNTSNYCEKGVNALPVVISSGENKTWNDSKLMKGDLIIKSGAKLTIKCSIHMPPGARIVVENGGHLVIDGGTITNDCNEVWQGIVVYGDNNSPQFGNNQGKVEMMNNARIENAGLGVLLMGQDASGNLAWGTAGGVIKADNSTFYNCRRAVAFMSYMDYTNGGNPIGNYSHFYNCEFIVDDNYNELYANTIYPVGISMWEVHNVQVKGCDFKNEITTTNTVHQKYHGHAIVSNDASPDISPILSVPPIGTPPQVLDRNTFAGFDLGVYAFNTGEVNMMRIQDNIFSDNKIGVYFDHVSNASIIENRFYIPHLSIGSSSYAVSASGCFLKNSYDFELEENNFKGTADGNNFDGGVAIENMSVDNEYHDEIIYKNNFDELGYGFLAYGDNGNNYGTNGANYYHGAELKCNDFGQYESNFQDVYIHRKSSIKPVQGSPAVPASNRFSPQPTGGSFAHIFIGPDGRLIDAYHHNTDNITIPFLSDIAQVNKVNSGLPYDDRRYCPSDLAGDIKGDVKGGDVKDGKVEIQLVQGQLDHLVMNTKSILNGGIKEDIMEVLLDDLKTSQEVRELLIKGSPNLDDEVLIAAINREIPLDQWHLTEVLVWNSRLSNDVMNALYNKQPLTPYQFSLVENVEGNSQRFLLEMEIDAKKSELAKLKSDYILKAWASETVNVYEEIIELYSSEDQNYAMAQCIDAYTKLKNFDTAKNIIDNYTSKKEDDQFVNYYSLKLDLEKNNRSWFQMTRNEQLLVNDMANSKDLFIQEKAHNVLRLINSDYVQFTELPIDLSKPRARMAYIGTEANAFDNLMEVSYLQGTNELVFVHTEKNTRYVISNTLGQIVEEGRLQSNVETKDMSYLNSGVYYIKLVSSENNTCEEQFIVR